MNCSSKTLFILLLCSLMLLPISIYAKKSNQRYTYSMCSHPDYYCIKVKGGMSWKKLWPDPEQRDLLQRLNRTNMRLRYGMKVVVPKKLASKSIWDISPFPRYLKNYQGKKVIIVNQKKLAWGAYDDKGELQWWGPISSGKDYCRDIGRSCKTITGGFYVFNRDGPGCESNVFPVGRGGADMPYCMFFYRGFALHGSREVPGYRDSHGCVRIFLRDAKWLNQNFIKLPNKDNNFQGTAVIIQNL